MLGLWFTTKVLSVLHGTEEDFHKYLWGVTRGGSRGKTTCKGLFMTEQRWVQQLLPQAQSVIKCPDKPPCTWSLALGHHLRISCHLLSQFSQDVQNHRCPKSLMAPKFRKLLDHPAVQGWKVCQHRTWAQGGWDTDPPQPEPPHMKGLWKAGSRGTTRKDTTVGGHKVLVLLGTFQVRYSLVTCASGWKGGFRCREWKEWLWIWNRKKN